MASSSSNSPLVLTHAEITSFHSVDRSLYARLTLDLRQDPFLSMHVTALWIWLERQGCHPGTLILRINDLIDQSLHGLFDEAVACLACLDNRSFRPENEYRVLHLTREITCWDFITLKEFYTNRDEIASDIKKIYVDEMCTMAFNDIIREAVVMQVFQNWPSNNNGGLGFGTNPSSNHYIYRSGQLCSRLSNSRVEMEAYREFLDNELADVLEQDYYYYIHGEEQSDEEKEYEEEVVYYNNGVPPEERTLFLTFSKGYPISEREVAHFFTRKYGDIYEAIRMQEKQKGEQQALYARLVLRSDSAIPVVLGTKAKAKFSINGKHVCARRYVPRGGPTSNVRS